MMRDLRYGLRMLSKRPGFAIIAVLTLAFGIGANTIVFSGVYSLLLSGLPYPNADRLVVISQATKSGIETGVSYDDFVDWQQQNTALEKMAASKTLTMNLTDRDAVERAAVSRITQEFFALLGGRPIVGRGFADKEFRADSAKVVLLSYVFWQKLFGGDKEVVGQRLLLDGEEFTVIGVMPQSFQYPFRAALWMPLNSSKNAGPTGANNCEVIALLKQGATVESAAKEITLLAERSARETRARQSDMAIKVNALGDTLPVVSKYRTPIIVLQLAVVFVLLIASANLANMLIARNADRRQEFTIRLAIGAGRARLVRQLLAESLIVGLIGSLLGVLLAVWGLGALQAAVAFRLPGGMEVEINAAVILITLAVSLLTSLGVGLVPAFIASRQDISESLKSGASNTTFDPRQKRFSKILVAAEVALAVLLLAGAGLMIRTFLNLTREEPGFDPDNAIALSLSLAAPERPDYGGLASYYEETIKQIKALPGIESAGAVTYLPLVGYNPGTDFLIEGQTPMRADIQPVTAEYFQAMGVPLVRGRMFGEADMSATPQSAIINSAMAKRFWPDSDPLGKSILLTGDNVARAPLIIAGIVGDVKQFGLHSDPRPEIYIPAYRHSMTMIVRTSKPAENLFVALGDIVEQASGNRVAYSLKTMEQVVADSVEKRRIFMLLLGTLSAVALTMAAMGIYGVISYAVSQRTREIGIRMALGAEGHHIIRSVIKQGMSLAGFGVCVGLAVSLALTRAMTGLLYGVSPVDPLVLASLALLISAVAFLASYIPARRAAKVDPIVALRAE